MADAVVSRLGQADGSGDDRALFLIRYAGEVLEQFDLSTVFLSRHTVRQIANGKSAQFPALGLGDAAYHTPGTEILGTKILANERLIAIDDQLIAARFIANIDEAMNHYDVRSIYSKDAGRALARTFDAHVAQVGVLAARASSTISGQTAPGSGDNVEGTVITDADADVNPDSFVQSLFTMGQTFDEKNVADENRFCFIPPAIYNRLVQNTDLINTLWGGSGSLAAGKVYEIAGFQLIKTNNLPKTHITTGPTAYQGDFRYTVALCMTPEAVGTVKLIDVATEMAYDIRRQGTLVVAKYAMGHGVLRPECAGEIKTQ
jgi:hypothetical protein